MTNYRILYMKGGATLVVIDRDGEYFTSNLDCIDPENWEEKIGVNRDDIMVIEPISEARFEYLREMAIRQIRKKDMQSALEIRTLTHQASSAGLLPESMKQRAEDEAPVEKPQVKQPKKPAMQVVRDEETLDPPAQPPEAQFSAPIAPAMVGDKKESYDGTVVEIPTPGMK